MSGADTSHDGKRLAFFRLNGKQMELVSTDLDGSNAKVLMSAVATFSYRKPRWSPDDGTVAYIHSRENWADDVYTVSATGGTPRQVTTDSTLMSGVAWTPDGTNITYATNQSAERGRSIRYWLIHPDGSDARVAITQGTWAAWSWDSKWLYYAEWSPVEVTGSSRLMKTPAAAGTPLVMRSDNARGAAVAPDGSALYYIVPLQNLSGSLDYELRVARPEDGPSKLLGRIPGERVPLWQGLHPVISKDGKWLLMPLDDNLGTKIWAASTSDGRLMRLTDFGQKRTFHRPAYLVVVGRQIGIRRSRRG